jgi:hypothetical protein
MKKILLIFGVVVLVILILFSLRFLIGGPEDDWICVDGQWVKHGAPSTPMPSKPCGEEELIGGRQDEHGCLIAAGYQWCPSQKKCMRMWEEYCEEYKDQYRGKTATSSDFNCQSFTPEECPDECVVCPPCAACSSISCQSKEFCESIGFNKDWYKEIKRGINSFEECMADGNPVMESYPRQCRTKDGRIFVEEIDIKQ